MENPLRTVMEAFTEFQRALIRERQREGIAAGVERNVYRGHRSLSTAAQVAEPARRSGRNKPSTLPAHASLGR